MYMRVDVQLYRARSHEPRGFITLTLYVHARKTSYCLANNPIKAHFVSVWLINIFVFFSCYLNVNLFLQQQ